MNEDYYLTEQEQLEYEYWLEQQDEQTINGYDD